MNSRFILARPSGGGHHWQHWITYLVDFPKGIIDVRRGSHTYDSCSLAFRYEENYRRISLLQNRRDSEKPFFISDGWTTDEDGIRTPIRFEPVKIAYGTGRVDRSWESVKGNAAFDILDKAIDDYTVLEPRLRYEHCYQMRSGMARLDLAAELKKVFDQLSHSQVVFCARDPWFQKDQPADSLRSLYSSGIGRYYEETDFLTEQLETVYPSPIGKPSRKDIARCVRRFVARHPTRATKTLLSLLAGASALKAA